MDEKVKEVRCTKIHKNFSESLSCVDCMSAVYQARENELLSLLEKKEKRIKELENELHQAATDISLWRERHADLCQEIIKLNRKLKVLTYDCP